MNGQTGCPDNSNPKLRMIAFWNIAASGHRLRSPDGENYAAISPILGNKPELLAELARNSFRAAFIEALHRHRLLAEVDDYLRRTTV